MSGESVVRQAFLQQAEACERLGSPFTARLCRLVGAALEPGTPVTDALLGWPGNPRSDALALRLAGALYGLVLDGTAPDLGAVYPPNEVEDAALGAAVAAALERHDARIRYWLTVPPQTNETARTGALAPGLLAVAGATGLPLICSEIGASAGLNLLWHRFAYRLGSGEWGDPASPVRIAPDWEGKAPALPRAEIAESAGCDLNPIDVADEAAALRLLAYVWADQSARLERMRAAIALARDEGVRVEAADAADWLAARLAIPRPGRAHVVVHSIMWQYLPRKTQDRIAMLIAEAGARASAEAPLAWLRLEPDGAGSAEAGAALTLTRWPGGAERSLARADYHGRWVRWLAT